MTQPLWKASLEHAVRDRIAKLPPKQGAALSLVNDVIQGWATATDEQGGSWDVAVWRQRLAGSPLLEHVDSVADNLALPEGGASITREHVFSFTGEPIRLFVAAMAWGFGPARYGWYRTDRMFGDNASVRLPKLVDELRAASDAPAQVWRVLMGKDGLRGLGPAFGTKLGYFAGYDRDQGRGPLIADYRTAWAFWALTGIWDTRISADLYQRYVETTSDWAVRLGQRSDEVERALFDLGWYTVRIWRDLRER